MTVYARSDVCAVVISKTHGGCGDAHARPADSKEWALTCHGGCEDYLRHDPLWSATPQNVPETPDEVDMRLDSEKRGKLAQERQTAEALEHLADLPAALRALARLGAQDSPPAPAQAAVKAVEDAVPDVDGMSFPELRSYAEELGVPIAKSRAGQLKIIKQALEQQPA